MKRDTMIEVLSADRQLNGQLIRYAVYPVNPDETYQERAVFVPCAGPVAYNGMKIRESELLTMPGAGLKS